MNTDRTTIQLWLMNSESERTKLGTAGRGLFCCMYLHRLRRTKENTEVRRLDIW
jgi:hypothetical protein